MMNVLVKTSNMSREEWLKQRQRGIGGSDIAGIVGLSPWSSPIKVYQSKIGELPDMGEESEAIYFGTILEEVVAKEFERRTGMKVRKKNAILYHSEENKWMVANVDRLIVGKKEGLECKTTNAFAASEWKDEKIPDQYFLQCQWYMGVTGFKKWHIAVLIGGNQFIYKEIERDDELIEMLMQKGREFWFNHVIPKEPPEFDGSKASTELLKYMYPESESNTVIELSSSYADMLEEYDKIKDQIDQLSVKKMEIENKIKAAMKEKEKAKVNNRMIIWRTLTSNRFDTKRFKKDHFDLYTRYVRETPQRKFQIK